MTADQLEEWLRAVEEEAERVESTAHALRVQVAVIKRRLEEWKEAHGPGGAAS